MEKFFHKNKLLGIRVRSFKAGRVALTAESESLQALSFFESKGFKVRPHRHRPIKRATDSLQECLVVMAGRIRVDLFGGGQAVVRRVVVKSGELFITVSGGHAVTFFEASRVFEIKNGPFKNDRVSLEDTK